MKKNLISNTAKKVKPEIKQHVTKNLDIIDQIYDILERKAWTQKDLAKKMGKNESEISKWLSGLHNLTIKTIAKLEVVLGEDIILTPIEAQKQYQKTPDVVVKVAKVHEKNGNIQYSEPSIYNSKATSFIHSSQIA